MTRLEWHAEGVDAVSRALSRIQSFRQALIDARKAFTHCGCVSWRDDVNDLLRQTERMPGTLQNAYNMLSTNQPKDLDSLGAPVHE